MKRIMIIAALATIATFRPAMAEPSACKGLVQDSCTASAACAWRPALVKGESKLKSGELAKRNVKAHCRKAPAPRKAA